mgnify:CR=1 FL=1|tara:strand:- start:7380 stop:9185 length:1806 start_codon:yes stop_codon:yes gene_type:complete
MTTIYNPQQLEADENTFITALAFATGTGILTATRNDGVAITQSLDGRYATANTYVSSAAFDTSDGELTLTRTDAGTVVVDLDGRYSQTDVHLDSAAFNSGTRVLTLTLTDASTVTVTIPAGADANDYVNAASFNTGDGVLTLTRTDTGTVTVDLDGRYVETANDIYLSGVAWDQNTGDLTFSRNNSTNIVENIDGRYVPFKYTVGVVTDLDDLVTTQVQVCDKTAANRPTASSASMDNFSVLVIQAGSGGSQLCIASDADSSDNQAWIRMWKDDAGSYTFTDWTELPTSTTGNFVPFDLTIPSPSYNLNDYTTTGIFSVDKNATNIPSSMPSWNDEAVLQVYKSGADNGIQLVYSASGTATTEVGRIFFRTWEDYAGVTWSGWVGVNTGGISGDLENAYGAVDLDSAAYRNTGYWGLGAKGAATTWPAELPATSDYNILETIKTGSLGAGQQKIMCADYDSGTAPDTHIREWKRVFDSSAETDWYEYQFQGQPIYKQVLHTTLYVSATHGNNPDTSNTAAYYVTLGGNSLYLYGFQNGYAEGQTMRIFRETNSTSVIVTIYNNIYYAVQPISLMNGGTSLTLINYQSAEFIFHNNIWFQYK